VTELNVTMVAFHGKTKPEALKELLREVLNTVTSSLPTSLSWSFRSYDFTQMHATVIGMEADVADGQLYGRWFQKNKHDSRLIDINCLHASFKNLVHPDKPLFTIRFGGFPEAYCKCKKQHPHACDDWPCASALDVLDVFHSCDRTSYQGSFYAFSPGPVMITGWPIEGPNELHTFPHSLYQFRQSVEQCGLADKYHYHHDHENGHWKDDDCFIRIGSFLGPLPPDQFCATENAVRAFLSNRKPVVIDMTVDDVSIVLYDNPSLEEQYVRERVPLATFLSDPCTLKEVYNTFLKQSGG